MKRKEGKAFILFRKSCLESERKKLQKRGLRRKSFTLRTTPFIRFESIYDNKNEMLF